MIANQFFGDDVIIRMTARHERFAALAFVAGNIAGRIFHTKSNWLKKAAVVALPTPTGPAKINPCGKRFAPIRPPKLIDCNVGCSKMSFQSFMTAMQNARKCAGRIYSFRHHVFACTASSVRDRHRSRDTDPAFPPPARGNFSAPAHDTPAGRKFDAIFCPLHAGDAAGGRHVQDQCEIGPAALDRHLTCGFNLIFVKPIAARVDTPACWKQTGR